MHESDWDMLACLLERVMVIPGGWQVRRATIERELAARGCTLDLEEFTSMFDDDANDKYRNWQRGQFLPRERKTEGGK